MNYLDTQDDREPDEAELELISKLSMEQIANIDAEILSATDSKFKKVALVVGIVTSEQIRSGVRLPDTFYSGRVKQLVSNGYLEVQGELKRMRFSEVKRIK